MNSSRPPLIEHGKMVEPTCFSKLKSSTKNRKGMLIRFILILFPQASREFLEYRKDFEKKKKNCELRGTSFDHLRTTLKT